MQSSLVLVTDKSRLRLDARVRRANLAAAMPGFARAIAAFADDLKLPPGGVVGAYHALPGEADPALLLAMLAARGHTIAWPRVAAKDGALGFHTIPDGEALRPGAYGIQEPAAHFPSAAPHLLLVPLLAYDNRGHRLGYGGGFYDRTLEALRVPAIGVAFSGQEVISLPVEAHDMALSGILTEHGLKRFS